MYLTLMASQSVDPQGSVQDGIRVLPLPAKMGYFGTLPWPRGKPPECGKFTHICPPPCATIPECGVVTRASARQMTAAGANCIIARPGAHKQTISALFRYAQRVGQMTAHRTAHSCLCVFDGWTLKRRRLENLPESGGHFRSLCGRGTDNNSLEWFVLK